jgi:flagellar motor switch protein FliN/FliY
MYNHMNLIPIEVTVVLGSAQMKISKLLKLGRGSIILFDNKEEEVSILIKDKLIAKGTLSVNKKGSIVTTITETL